MLGWRALPILAARALSAACTLDVAGHIGDAGRGRARTQGPSSRPAAGIHAAAGGATQLCGLLLEVGLVEEFFFRALLQERLASVLGSRWGGLVAGALLFGLVHAPGFYLRPARTMELLGDHPSLLMAVGYAVVMTSVAGLLMGMLWMRTKNLAVVILVHAAGDWLQGVVPFVTAFHLPR